ncbi:MAG: hypothetical protein HY590_04490 [Candidatus Omnitrophica bacterium]|nr:hypothetical protein [Candidatus Omnitrophota bacterium]
MKQVTKTPYTVNRKPYTLFIRAVSLLVAELFLFSSLFPAWADPFPTPTSSFLRTRSARDGGEVQNLRNALQERPALIREASGNAHYKAYVLADSLFSLIALEENEADARAIQDPKSPLSFQYSVEGMVMLTMVRTAANLDLPGASELLRLIEKGDVIFLKASAILHPELGEADSPLWNRTAEEDAMQLLWHERLHLAIARLAREKPQVWERIFGTIRQTPYEGMKNIRDSLKKAYPDHPDDALADEVLAYLLGAMRDQEWLRSIIHKMFPNDLAEMILRLQEETRPSTEEVAQLQTTAQEVGIHEDIPAYYPLLKEAIRKGRPERESPFGITRREGKGFWVGEDLFIHIYDIEKERVLLQVEQKGQILATVPMKVGEAPWKSLMRGILAKGEDGREYSFSLYLKGVTKRREAHLSVVAPKMVRIDQPEVMKLEGDSARDGGEKYVEESKWPELLYHMKRFETGDLETRLGALDAIQEGLFHHPRLPRDEVIAFLLKHYQDAKETKIEILRSHLLGVLIHLGIRSPNIQALFDEEIGSGGTSPRLLQEALLAFADTLYRGETTFISPKTLETFKRLLSHADEEISYAALYVFVNALGGLAHEGKPVLKLEEMVQDKRFVKRLRKLITSPQFSTAYLSEDLLQRLGLSRGSPERPVEAYANWLETHALRKRENYPTLNAKQMGQLYRLIHQNENENLPSQFIGDLFRNGKKIVFIADATRTGRSLPRLAEDMLRLKEEVGLNRLGLPFPPSEAENLEKFARGEITLAQWSYGTRHFLSEPGDMEGLKYAESFRQMLRILNGKIRLIFYGKEMEEGEVALFTHLRPIQEAYDRLGSPRILVMGTQTMGMQLARKNLITRNDWVKFSIASELEQRIGKDHIASLIQVDEEAWFWDHFADLHNLVELVEEFPITQSFGLQIQGTPIAWLQFSRSYQEPFGSAWDGIIFRKVGIDQETEQGTEAVWKKVRLEERPQRYLQVRFGGRVWVEAGRFIYRVWVEDDTVHFRGYDREQYVPRGTIHSWPFGKMFTIGRLWKEYSINDPALSRIHLTMVVVRDAQGHLLLAMQDQNSRNGTGVAWNAPTAARDGGLKQYERLFMPQEPVTSPIRIPKHIEVLRQQI